jgi:hypothetical protein
MWRKDWKMTEGLLKREGPRSRRKVRTPESDSRLGAIFVLSCLDYVYKSSAENPESRFSVAPPEDPNSVLKIRLWEIDVFFAEAGSPQFTNVLKWPKIPGCASIRLVQKFLR